MKKLLPVLALFLALCFLLCACGGGKDETTDPVTEQVTDPATDPSASPTTDPATEPSVEPATGESTTEPEEVEITFGESEQPTEMKSSGAKAAQTLYEEKIESIPESSRENIKAIYDNTLCAMNMVDGTPDEIKEDLNLLYNELNKALDAAQKVDNVKDLAVSELQSMYRSMTAIKNDACATALESVYKNAETTVLQMIDSGAGENEIFAVVAGFRSAMEVQTALVFETRLLTVKADLKLSVEESLLLLGEITDDSALAGAIASFKAQATYKIDAAINFDELARIGDEILTETKQFVEEKISEYIQKVKTAAFAELDELEKTLLSKITDEDLKKEIDSFYKTEKDKIDAIGTIAEAKEVAAGIPADCQAFSGRILTLALTKAKAAALAQLDEAVQTVLAKLDDDSLKSELNSFYQAEKTKLETINSLEDVQTFLTGFDEDLKEEAKTLLASQLAKLKEKALSELDEVVGSALAKLSDQDLKDELNAFYLTEKEKINAVDSMDSAKATLKTISDDTKAEALKVLADELNKLKAEAVSALDGVVNPLLSKITDEDLKKELTAFYEKEKAIILAVDALDSIKSVVENVMSDTEEESTKIGAAQLAKLKEKALAELDGIVENGLTKLDDDDLKKELNDFYATEKGKIEAINSLDSAVDAVETILEDSEKFVLKLLAKKIEALRAEVKGYVNDLKAAYETDVYSFLPESMKPTYAGRLVTSAPSSDYSTDTAISAIPSGGYGEQWHMVIENLENSRIFFRGFNTISAAFAIVLDHLDSEYTAEIDKTFEKDGFTASIAFSNGVLTISVSYTTAIDNSFFGNVSPAITMAFDSESGESTISINVTDTNKLKVFISEDKYEFGMKIGVNQLTRSSYLVIEKKTDGSTEGHINEYTTVSVGGKGTEIEASADFFADDTYVSVVGNKASGMVAFTGYINELYDVKNGKMLGYKVMETLSAVTYNTLWFNLSDISGITSVKVTEKTEANESGKSTVDVYLNASTKLMAPTYNTKLMVKTSRKYDIELRKTYFYGVDGDGKAVEFEFDVPMMFIQDGENIESYASDMKADNNITSAVTLAPAHLAKIRADYEALIPAFITNKANNTSADVDAFLNR